MTCPRCHDTGWTCEEHPEQPMGHDGCLGAGMPCECNREEPPEPPAGMEIVEPRDKAKDH